MQNRLPLSDKLFLGLLETFICLGLDILQQFERARAPISNICLMYFIMV